QTEKASRWPRRYGESTSAADRAEYGWSGVCAHRTRCWRYWPGMPPKDDDGEDDHDDNEDPCDGRSVSHPPAVKIVGQEVIHDHQTRVGGTALSHDVSLRKHLERSDEPHDEMEENDGRHHRHRDVQPLAKGGGSVDLGGFIVLRRHPLQPRQKDDHGVAHSPHAHQREGWNHLALIVNPQEARVAEQVEKADEEDEV